MSLNHRSAPERLRTEDSWIEISSRHSSSSLHSIGPETVTTGLRTTHNLESRTSNPQRAVLRQPTARAESVADSSQDEYEESESGSDRVLSSSNEDITRSADDEDEDDTSTALGATTTIRGVFTPQPNAFSHPPTADSSRSMPVPNSYFPSAPHVTNTDRIPSNRMMTQRAITHRTNSRGPVSVSQPDHDAALRASLTTLLSCAAAVRPKGRDPLVQPGRHAQPTSLRLVPESDLHIATSRPEKQPTKRRSRESSKERQAKKMRAMRSTTSYEDLITGPTAMTWMISAGVVLVFSAISFSAGYAWGREVGRFESDVPCTSCGPATMKVGGSGLRKLRWSTAAQSVRA